MKTNISLKKYLALTFTLGAILLVFHPSPIWGRMAKNHGSERDFNYRSKRVANPENLERWRKLSPEKKKLFFRRYRKWEKLPERKRRQILRRYRKFRNLPPEKRKRLRNRWRRLKALSPAERKNLRAFMKKFKTFPPERRRALRQEVKILRKKSGEERRNYFMNLGELRGLNLNEKEAFYKFLLGRHNRD